MSRLREAAQAVVDMFYHRSWGTTSYIPASVEALRDALAEPDEVLAEREACAEVLVGKISRYEQIAQQYAVRGEYDDERETRSQMRALSDCADAIRARGNT